MGGPHVGCHFITLSVVGKSLLIFLSQVGNCFPRFVGSQ